MSSTSFSSGTVIASSWLNDVNNAVYNGDFPTQISSSGINYTQGGTGSVTETAAAKLQQIVSVGDFGAVGNGTTDDTAAIQAAINYCATFWTADVTASPVLYLTGKHLISSSLIINRLVDTMNSEFRIVGNGPGHGFYTTTSMTCFDSTLTFSTAPVSEFVTFEGVEFSTSSSSNSVYAVSQKFLRMKFLNSQFYLTHAVNASIYVQTYYFIACNIRYTPFGFVNSAGLFDVTFNGCVIENGSTLVRSIGTTYGTSGLRLINNLIEGMSGETIQATGANGFCLIGNHIESNQTLDFNFFAGTLTNGSITVIGNYIYNPNGPTFYYGPTNAVFSSGNTCFPNTLHSNVLQDVSLVSISDNCLNASSVAIPPTDATVYSTVNGVYRAGGAEDTWTDSANQITKDINGNFGIGNAPLSTNRLFVRGVDQTSSNYSGAFTDSAGNTIMSFRNDRQIVAPALQNYANDAAAATGGISVGSLYRNGSVVQVRVS
jgi:hypothetical protein